MWLVILFIAIACALSIPALVLLIETIAALNPFCDPLRKTSDGSALSKRVAVIIPAHNESTGILPTISDLKPQLQADDRLIVVADNCSDDTGVAASDASAEVLMRNDLSKVGKGYALAHALVHLNEAPPDFVLFIDADCRIQNDLVPRLKQMCLATGRPVQAGFLMFAPSYSADDQRIAEFFWLIRNWVRPLGLASLGLPVQLMGSGTIFPWHVILKAHLAHGNLVEDLKFGLDLCAAGHPAVFYPFVVNTSEFPMTKKGTETQRQRWILGHLSLISTLVPRYLLRALLTRNLGLFVLAIDVAVPPFSLFLPLLVVLLFLSSLFLLQGIPSPIIICSINCLTVFLALFLGWLRFGRNTLPPNQLGQGLFSLTKRLVFYARIYFGRKANSWIRTDRSNKD